MAKSLVVVESPTKARTLRKLLSRSYDVTASMGHVKDLPKSQLGVDVKQDFTPKHISRLEVHEGRKAARSRPLPPPRAISLPRVHAQRARRILDRLFGYKLS